MRRLKQLDYLCILSSDLHIFLLNSVCSLYNNLAFLKTGCSWSNLLTLLFRTDCQVYDSQPGCCLNSYRNPCFIFCEHILIRKQHACYFQEAKQRGISNNNTIQGAYFSKPHYLKLWVFQPGPDYSVSFCLFSLLPTYLIYLSPNLLFINLIYQLFTVVENYIHHPLY